MDKATQEKIEKLQILEQNLQHISVQKQAMETQLSEIDSALKAIDKDTKQAFKIIGSIMIETPKEDLVKDLNSKQEMLTVKVKSFEKQESKLKENSQSLQQEIIKTIEKDGK